MSMLQPSPNVLNAFGLRDPHLSPAPRGWGGGVLAGPIVLTPVADRARAFAPSAVGEVDPLIGKLQIGHTDLAYDEPGAPLGDAPVIYVDRSLDMSAGKAAAQVGHGSMMLAAAMSVGEARAWAGTGFKLSVREVSGEDFRTACAQDGAVIIVDAGFTEIAPDSATVCALRRLIA